MENTESIESSPFDEKILAFLEAHKDIDLPNPEHCPRQFAHLVKLWNYYKEHNNGSKETG